MCRYENQPTLELGAPGAARQQSRVTVRTKPSITLQLDRPRYVEIVSRIGRFFVALYRDGFIQITPKGKNLLVHVDDLILKIVLGHLFLGDLMRNRKTLMI